MHLIYYINSSINLYVKKVHFSNNTEFNIKSINQEFLLFLKSLNKYCIQYDVTEVSLLPLFTFFEKSVIFGNLGFNI